MQSVDLPANPAPATSGLKGMQSAGQDMRNSIGVENNWGWSPAFDLLDHVPKSVLAAGGPDEPVNVLIDSAGDIRHLLCTLARAKRHTQRPVHFYLYEPSLRTMARHVFFLVWLFEQTQLDRLEECAAEFLELLANTYVRESAQSAMRLIAKKAANLVRGGRDKLEGHVDVETFMKAKEADWMADQIDHWRTDKSEFNIDMQWNNRIRADIGDRYDAKENIMDWDFNMGLQPYTNHLRWPEYKDWRTLGVAYDWGRVNPRKGHKYEYTKPNKTLALFDRKGRGHYLGDVRIGPFAGLGVDTEYEKLRGRQHDGSFKWSNGLLAMHNVRAWLYELLTGEEWEWSEFKLGWDAPDYVQKQKHQTPVTERTMPRFKAFCCGIDLARLHLLLSARGDSPVFFHAMFVGAAGAQNLGTPERLSRMRPDGYIVAEVAKYMVYFDDAQKEALATKIRELLTQGGWAEATALEQRLHRLQPAFTLPFARERKQEAEKYTPAQLKDKLKYESLWGLAFVLPDRTAPPAEWAEPPKAAPAAAHVDPAAAVAEPVD
eukprot:TRINITY_DN42988_c0_g1_i1.p1 TRINITY_DN42988_c0_g1~~TRINITY_DN42988_c0_g1_i1.p1  ORF type:complete len:545 (+),score=200.75 TRINITY_DN42988_c0_g1_i1:61-1695(+)